MKWARIACLTAGLAVGLIPCAGSDQTNYDAGKSGAPELRLDLGARALGQGGACVADALGTAALVWNPAGLAQSTLSQLEGMHTFYLQYTTVEQLAYAQPISEGSGFGVQAVYVNYGELERTEVVDDIPQVVGKFIPSTWVLSAGYGLEVASSLSLGAVAKYYRNEISGTVYSAWAGDVGLQWGTQKDELKIGLTLQNLGTGVAGYPLPLTAKFGAMIALPFSFFEEDRWTLSADLDMAKQGVMKLSPRVGTEYQYQALALRVGYIAKEQANLGGAAGLTMGAGIRGRKTYVDYAASLVGFLGTVHQVSFGVLF